MSLLAKSKMIIEIYLKEENIKLNMFNSTKGEKEFH